MSLRHSTEEELERYILDFLSEDEAMAMDMHLGACEECSARLEKCQMAEAAKHARETVRVQWRPVPTWRQRLAAFSTGFRVPAAAAAAVLLVVLAARPWEASAPPLAIALQASRDFAATRAQSGRQLALNLDVTGLEDAGIRRIELVDAGGHTVVKSRAAMGRGPLVLLVRKRLEPGRYWIRLYGTATDPLREYGLEIYR